MNDLQPPVAANQSATGGLFRPSEHVPFNKKYPINRTSNKFMIHSVYTHTSELK